MSLGGHSLASNSGIKWMRTGELFGLRFSKFKYVSPHISSSILTASLLHNLHAQPTRLIDSKYGLSSLEFCTPSLSINQLEYFGPHFTSAPYYGLFLIISLLVSLSNPGL